MGRRFTILGLIPDRVPYRTLHQAVRLSWALCRGHDIHLGTNIRLGLASWALYLGLLTYALGIIWCVGLPTWSLSREQCRSGAILDRIPVPGLISGIGFPPWDLYKARTTLLGFVLGYGYPPRQCIRQASHYGPKSGMALQPWALYMSLGLPRLGLILRPRMAIQNQSI